MALEDASLGEIRMFAMPGTPRDWVPLDGRSLPEATVPWWPYLIGRAFGVSNGAYLVPDMRGRAPLGARDLVTPQGLAGGAEFVTLTLEQIPPHRHDVIASTAGAVVSPGNNFIGPVQANGTNAAFPIYGPAAPTVTLAAPTIAETGGGAGHENRQPVLAINFCLCVRGGYPSFEFGAPEDSLCLGEIRVFASASLPLHFLPCDGRTLEIQKYTDLYALIGTLYGGDGRSTFGLPNMSGRAPVGVGQGPGLSPYPLGTAAGSEAVSLGPWQMPAHGHGVAASSGPASDSVPSPSAALADAGANLLYETAGPQLPNLTPLDVETVATAGGFDVHPNIQPSLGLQFAICVRGELPTFF